MASNPASPPMSRRQLIAVALLSALLIAGLAAASCGGDKGRRPSSSVAGYSATPGRNVASPAERLAVTYFYYWYDLPDGPHSAPLTDHPAEADASYLDVGWFKKQLQDMTAAGIDIALPVYWGKFEPSSAVGLRNLVAAHDQLVADGASPPSIGMFLDTGAIGLLPAEQRDMTKPENQALFYALIRGFFNEVPDRLRAKIDGRPVVWIWAAYFDIEFDRSLFDYITAQFEADYGVRPYLVGEEIWRYAHPSGGDVDYDQVMPLDDFYIWGAALNGFVQPTGGIAEVGPGYDERTLPGPGRIGRFQDRQGGRFFEENLQRAIDAGVPILAIETWNEFHEASDVADSAEYGRRYIELTRQYVDRFKSLDLALPTATPQPTPQTLTLTPQARPTPTPTPTPTPVAHPAITGTPMPTVTPASSAPAPQPTSPPFIRGDVDCNGRVDSIDALDTLLMLTGGPMDHSACMSDARPQAADQTGDTDCSGSLDAVDALATLRFVARLPVQQHQPCTQIGEPSS